MKHFNEPKTKNTLTSELYFIVSYYILGGFLRAEQSNAGKILYEPVTCPGTTLLRAQKVLLVFSHQAIVPNFSYEF